MAEVTMRGFSENQKNELFQLAKNAKSQGLTLCDVFDKIAEKYGKAPGSVRNFYYKSIAEGSALDLKAKKLNYFSEDEEKKLISAVISERKNGMSLRSALLKIAGGDKTLAMRYQNKFANLIKKQRAKIMREVILQRERFGKCFNPYVYKNNCVKVQKLKREIDDLILSINQKCEFETNQLKTKLIEYEKITNGLTSNQSENNSVLFYFSKLKNKKSN